MRAVRLFLSVLTALALAGCMHRQQAYYMVDPATGQAMPVAQPYAQPGYGTPVYAQPGYAPAYAQPGYAQPAYAPQPTYAQPAYAQPGATYVQPEPAYPAAAAVQQSYGESQPVYAQPSYAAGAYAAPAAPQASAAAPERGLFTALRRKARRQQVYAAAPQAAPYVVAPGYAYASASATPEPAYTLDSGDKLRIVVFGQDGITNSYLVGADGQVNLPLIGNVPARGFTTAQLAQMITERLKQGYVREPHVSVEVEAYRPFFILGEVTTPGQYPYVANMTVEKAVAIAGGFSPRADKRKVELSRNAPGQQIKGDVPLNYPLRPGDTIVVKERWF